MSSLTNLLTFFASHRLFFSYTLHQLSSHLSYFSFFLISHGPFFTSALLSQFTNHLSSLFFLSLPCLVSYFSFSLALCTRLNWQFSVSFQVHIKSSLSYRISYGVETVEYCSLSSCFYEGKKSKGTV